MYMSKCSNLRFSNISLLMFKYKPTFQKYTRTYNALIFVFKHIGMVLYMVHTAFPINTVNQTQ